MSKRVFAFGGLAVILTTSLLLAMPKIMNTQGDNSPLRLIISTRSDVNYSVSNIPLTVTFENVSDKDIRILNAFKNPKTLPVFFRFSIKTSDETPIPIPGGGKVSFSQDSLEYIVLKQGQKTEIDVNLAQLLPPGTSLKEDTYSLSVLYQNQYGADCFKGTAESNTVQVHLVETK